MSSSSSSFLVLDLGSDFVEDEDNDEHEADSPRPRIDVLSAASETTKCSWKARVRIARVRTRWGQDNSADS